MKKTLIFLFSIFIALSEIILKINSLIGFYFYFALIISCYFVLTKKAKNKEIYQDLKIVFVFLIIPIIRISCLFLDIGFFWQIIVFYYLFLFLVVYYIFDLEIPYTKLKIKKIFYLLAILIGVVFFFISKKLIRLEEPILIMIVPIIAFSEEIFFRKMLQENISKEIGDIYGIVISSMLYAFFSLSFGITFFMFCIMFGLISAFFYYFSKSVHPCIILNLIMHIGIFI